MAAEAEEAMARRGRVMDFDRDGMITFVGTVQTRPEMLMFGMLLRPLSNQSS